MRPERCCYDGDKVNYGDQDNSTKDVSMRCFCCVVVY